jgi:hypothetical protein
MYFVQCPCCGDPVEIPDEAVGENRTEPCNFVACERCELTFDYDDVQVQSFAS